MGKTLPMLPELTEFVGTEMMYAMEASGSPDRDKRTTIDALRRYCTAKGVRFLVVDAPPQQESVAVDVGGTTDVVLLVTFHSPNGQMTNRGTVDIIGNPPDGCRVTVISRVATTYSLTGNFLSGDLSGLPNRSVVELVWCGEEQYFLDTAIGDYFETASETSTSVQAETTRAQTAESNLASMIQGEASKRQDAITQTQALISAEVDRATTADEKLENSVTGLEASFGATHRFHQNSTSWQDMPASSDSGWVEVCDLSLSTGEWLVEATGWYTTSVNNMGNYARVKHSQAILQSDDPAENYGWLGHGGPASGSFGDATPNSDGNVRVHPALCVVAEESRVVRLRLRLYQELNGMVNQGRGLITATRLSK